MTVKEFIIKATEDISEALEELNMDEDGVIRHVKFELSYGIRFDIPVCPDSGDLHIIDQDSPATHQYAVISMVIHPKSSPKKYSKSVTDIKL